MVALPDIEREFTQAPHSYQEPAGLPEQRLIRIEASTLLRALCGVALAASAFGVWIVPTGGGDPAMMLIKLVFSLALFWAGMLCLSVFVGGTDLPDVEVDNRARKLRVIHPQPDGRSARVTVHDFDELAELSLRDRMLTARDRQGRQIVSLELHDKRSERMLRNALSLAA
ncbi:hypothetical protein RA2_00385 [Roseovarius sp. A-2]|uniref:hypothetical protein n=1 Tax=Roseovarius sp. A-2 TaxID=1570360 RepID=UPI0009B57B44|nr:hypothetical protein [Roseovarius sp. A-2]GAW33349.1 hypothetical protein RA2_00385 [Roseovarius sp. A-2]